MRAPIHTRAARPCYTVNDAAARFSSIHTPLRRLYLYGNRMDTFPKELSVLFPNAEGLSLQNNLLRTLPAQVCSLTKLKWYAGFGRG